MGKQPVATIEQTTPAAVDLEAPATITLTLTDPQGRNWGTLVAEAKDFATGSTGFFTTGKVINPASGSKYQMQVQAVLVGSKPGSKK